MNRAHGEPQPYHPTNSHQNTFIPLFSPCDELLTSSPNSLYILITGYSTILLILTTTINLIVMNTQTTGTVYIYHSTFLTLLPKGSLLGYRASNEFSRTLIDGQEYIKGVDFEVIDGLAQEKFDNLNLIQL
jgi:hypothetical protein